MTKHKSVMLKETIDGLNLKEGMIVVDATLGGGGHSREILKKIGSKGILIALDRDIEAIKRFAEFPISNFQFPNKLEIPICKNKNIILVNDNFGNLENVLKSLGIEGVDAITADLGLSSDQLDDTERGFSFKSEADLDMRMNRDQDLTAKEVINFYTKEDLNRIIRDFGEEKLADKISQKIVKEREKKIITKTSDLVEIISQVMPEKFKHKKIHFATKTFQAIRIEVNQELKSIKKFTEIAINKLKPGGRIAIISFHSGEDRIVKDIFKKATIECECPVDFPVCRCDKKAQLKIISKKPIVAQTKEQEENPRARSAKLRIAEKI